MANDELVPRVLAALEFAAKKHRDQRRKGVEASPYINHIIRVTRLLAGTGGVRDVEMLCAAALHDTIEDTETSAGEIEHGFGAGVRALVQEVTDEKNLPKGERKRRQVRRAPTLSTRARQLKIADKIANIEDIAMAPPMGWSMERRRDYLTWAEEVVDACRGVNANLEARWDATLAEARRRLDGETSRG